MKGIVTCPQPEAAEVGRQALLNGGNCVDAAIATAFAQFIVDPQMCGPVGGWLAECRSTMLPPKSTFVLSSMGEPHSRQHRICTPSW